MVFTKNILLETTTGNTITDSAVMSDFRQARKVENVRLGQEAIFFKNGTVFCRVPYHRITRIFKRIEPVGAKLACCRMSFDVHRIVLCQDNVEVADIPFQDQREADFVMKFLAKSIPGVLVGVPV